MPKRYSVAPILRPGAKAYSATFRNATGERVTRSLDTRDEDDAKTICGWLVRLKKAEIKALAQLSTIERAGDRVPLKAVRLYFAVAEEPNAAVKVGREDLIECGRRARAELTKLGRSRAALLKRLIEFHVNSRQLELTSLELAAAQDALQREKAAREAIERTVLARVSRATEKAPDFNRALDEFKQHMLTIATKRNAGDYYRGIRRFLLGLPKELKSVAEILPAHVIRFLDERAAAGDQTRKMSRRRAWRALLTRFFSFLNQTYSLPSPLETVPPVSKQAVLRERGDIHWHDKPVVDAAIAAVPERWARICELRGLKVEPADVAVLQTIVATMGFAGLQLAELVWLRKEDVQFSVVDGVARARFWVTTVADPDDPGSRHLLKSGHRRRHVDIHPRYLLPLIQTQFDSRAGGVFLFRVLSVMRTRRRKSGGSIERWLEGTLSTLLRGHRGGKDQKKRPPTPGLLPEGMNAKSLRRTFGSLLIRSGKTTGEVAAAMGNTEEVVRDNYARILGCEVDVDF